MAMNTSGGQVDGLEASAGVKMRVRAGEKQAAGNFLARKLN